MRFPTSAVALAAGAGGLFSLMARGKLTLDLGWGRSTHQLGPLTVDIDAPRDLVFEQLAVPYLGRAPREVRDRVEVIERGEDMVVARHLTDVMFYTAETVEVVRFEAPERISFRHLRGPVPYAVESFELHERGDEGDGTELVYQGELGIDFWVLGRLAGRFWVLPEWLSTVESHLSEAAAAVEQRAASRRRRTGDTSAE